MTGFSANRGRRESLPQIDLRKPHRAASSATGLVGPEEGQGWHVQCCGPDAPNRLVYGNTAPMPGGPSSHALRQLRQYLNTLQPQQFVARLFSAGLPQGKRTYNLGDG